MRAIKQKPSETAGIVAEGFAKRQNKFRAKPTTQADSQAIEFSERAQSCTVCGDPLSDSFAPSPDGRCNTCADYRPRPRRFRRYSATAHCAVAGFTRPRHSSHITRRVYATA